MGAEAAFERLKGHPVWKLAGLSASSHGQHPKFREPFLPARMIAGMRATLRLFVLVGGLACAAAWSEHHPGGAVMSLELKSPDFTAGGNIPKQFTCDGADSSPALDWNAPPATTESFALIADDPDAPGGTWVHWVIFDLPAKLRGLPQNLPKNEQLADGSRQGRNDFKKIGYGGPCPPPGKPHRYFFKLYALDAKLSLKAGAAKKEVEQAMRGHILAQGEYMGRYSR
jgi:Raf kinase inhibitor-like YbhB/YbcL family protein